MTTDLESQALPSVGEMQTHFQVHSFLTAEAAALDAGDFWAWLEFFDQEIDYWMPIRKTVAYGSDRKAFTGRSGENSYFDEDRASLERRVRKLETGYSWSEDPPSRTRHMFSNLRILHQDAQTIDVECAFAVYRSRLGNEDELWVGKRLDQLRRGRNNDFLIAKRHIFIDQSLLAAKNLSTFF